MARKSLIKKIYSLLRYDWPIHFLLVLTNWLPDNVIFVRLRGYLIRHFFGSCGSNLRVSRNNTFYNSKLIHLGSDIFIANGCWFCAGEEIIIGDQVMFGPYCVIVSENHIRRHGSFRFGEPQEAPIKIGKGSWVAAHVTIIAGSEIGEGSLIAAGAVVIKKIPADVLAAGVPARIIREIKET